MATCVLNDDHLELPISEARIGEVVACVLELEGVERACEVSVDIVGADEMAALNAEWRGIDEPTDVLSFECDSPFDDEVPAGEPVELGDIVVAPEVIREQAPDFGNSFEQEFTLMLVHSALHLLGYDHMDEDEALAMEDRQLAVLQELARRQGRDPGAVRIGPMTRHAEGED